MLIYLHSTYGFLPPQCLLLPSCHSIYSFLAAQYSLLHYFECTYDFCLSRVRLLADADLQGQKQITCLH
jgi:hypothetical protein